MGATEKRRGTPLLFLIMETVQNQFRSFYIASNRNFIRNAIFREITGCFSFSIQIFNHICCNSQQWNVILRNVLYGIWFMVHAQLDILSLGEIHPKLTDFSSRLHGTGYIHINSFTFIFRHFYATVTHSGE